MIAGGRSRSAAVVGERGGARRLRAAAGPSAAVRRSARSSRRRPRRPRCRAGRRGARRSRGCPGSPAGPVQALAPPELRTTARTRPPVTTCSVHSTGAALTRLAVKTPAAASSGPSLTTSATSGLPLALRPAARPRPPGSPGGCGDAHGATPLRRTGRPVQAGRGRGWRTGWPGRRRPCRGCRWR